MKQPGWLYEGWTMEMFQHASQPKRIYFFFTKPLRNVGFASFTWTLDIRMLASEIRQSLKRMQKAYLVECSPDRMARLARCADDAKET